MHPDIPEAGGREGRPDTLLPPCSGTPGGLTPERLPHMNVSAVCDDSLWPRFRGKGRILRLFLCQDLWL